MTNDIEHEFPGILGEAGSADIDALVFLVMAQAVADANADLKAIMDELRRRNERIAHLRRLLAGLAAWRETHGGADSDLVNSAKDLAGDLLRSTSDMSDLMQMRLQAVMDRRSKMLAALSNLLKKQSDTAACIIKNMK